MLTEQRQRHQPRRPFTDEFKREAVAKFFALDITMAQYCEELGIDRETLKRWINQCEGVRKDAPPQDERVLAQENRRLRMENEFLRKVLRFFGSQ